MTEKANSFCVAKDKILSFLARHTTLRNFVLGAGMIDISGDYKRNKQNWIVEEIKTRSVRDKISENKASSIVLTEFNFGLLFYVMTAISFLTFGLWLMIVKASLVIWIIWFIIYVFILGLMGAWTTIYVEYEIDKLLNNEILELSKGKE